MTKSQFNPSKGVTKLGKLLEKKKLKMNKLYDAAYELFTLNGVRNTIIDDIVKHAGVAKGTFYLYCKDKYDLVDKVIIRKTSIVLKHALEAIDEKRKTEPLSFQQSVIFFADYLIKYFQKDTKLLELIFTNLSWELYEKAFDGEELKTAREAFIKNFVTSGSSRDEAQRRLYIIVVMVGHVCYNSIVLEKPYKFEEVKDELYRAIERILE